MPPVISASDVSGIIMSAVRGAVSFTDAMKTDNEFSVGLFRLNPPGQTCYIPDWSMLLSLV